MSYQGDSRPRLCARPFGQTGCKCHTGSASRSLLNRSHSKRPRCRPLSLERHSLLSRSVFLLSWLKMFFSEINSAFGAINFSPRCTLDQYTSHEPYRPPSLPAGNKCHTHSDCCRHRPSLPHSVCHVLL